MHQHVCPLGLSLEERLLRLLLLRSNYATLFVEAGQLVVHALNREELLLEEALGLHEEGLCFADGASDILAGPL